jgi:hypothetical protein
MKKECLRLGAFAALFLLVALAPALYAGGVEEKIAALESELAALKAQQVEIKREAQDATAAAAALPEFSYRNGRGLTIRGADRSWQANLSYEGQGQMSFFPGGARSLDDDTANDGPSQGAMVVRHNEIGFNFQLDDGLFEMGTTIRFDSSPPRSKSESLAINFNTFSPYYPIFEFVHTGIRPFFDPVYNSSSTSGTTLDRAFVNDSLYSTASTKGVGLIWEEVPLGLGDFTTGVVYSTGHDFDSKNTSNSNNERSFNTGINVRPFRGMKGSPLAGLGLGVAWVRDHTDSNHGGDYIAISMGPSANSVDVFGLTTRGERTNTAVWGTYSQGPIRFGASYNWHKAERDFTGDAGGIKVGDVKMKVLVVRSGLFIWGPDGFLSGSENAGLMLAYNHTRNYFDAGSGFSADFGTEDNNFSAMRRYHINQHIGLLRYFYKPNVIFAVEYQASEVSKMNGGGAAAEARRRLGIGRDGGTAQTITLAMKLNF